MATSQKNISKRSAMKVKKDIGLDITKSKLHKLKISGFNVSPRILYVHVGDQLHFYIDESNKSNPSRKAMFEFSFKSTIPALCIKKSCEISLNEKFECKSSWTSPPLLSAGTLEFRETINGSTEMAGTICVENHKPKSSMKEKAEEEISSTMIDVAIVEDTSSKLSNSAKRRAKLARRKAREKESCCVVEDDIECLTERTVVLDSVMQTKQPAKSPTSGVTLELLKVVEQECQKHETHSLLNQVKEQREEAFQHGGPVEHQTSSMSTSSPPILVSSSVQAQVYEVVVKQGRFDPSSLLIEGGSTVNWTVSSTVVGSLRLACHALGLESPAIAPGCCWSCTFPIVSPELSSCSVGVHLNKDTSKYEATVMMEDQVFLGKCKIELSNKKLNGFDSRKSSPTQKLSPNRMSPASLTKPYCTSSSSSFADSDDIHSDSDGDIEYKASYHDVTAYPTYNGSSKSGVGSDHPAVATRYSGMPPQLARVALMGSFGGVGMMSNAGATKPLSELKVQLPPRYSKAQRTSVWKAGGSGGEEEDSDSFEEELPGESFIGELSYRNSEEAEDLFPTQEASKYGNLVLPSALDVSPLTSPDSTPAHSPVRKRSPISSRSPSWSETGDPSTVAAAAAVASILVAAKSSKPFEQNQGALCETSPSSHQNLPGLPFRMVNSASRAGSSSTHARRVRVYEDSEGTADSDDASSLSSAATPVTRSPMMTMMTKQNDPLYGKFYSPGSMNAVSKGIMNDLFMAHLKHDEQAMENKEKSERQHCSSHDDDDNAALNIYAEHLASSNVLDQNKERLLVNDSTEQAEKSDPELPTSILDKKMKELLVNDSKQVEKGDPEIIFGALVQDEDLPKKKKKRKKKNKAGQLGSKQSNTGSTVELAAEEIDIVFGSFGGELNVSKEEVVDVIVEKENPVVDISPVEQATAPASSSTQVRNEDILSTLFGLEIHSQPKDDSFLLSVSELENEEAWVTKTRKRGSARRTTTSSQSMDGKLAKKKNGVLPLDSTEEVDNTKVVVGGAHASSDDYEHTDNTTLIHENSQSQIQPKTLKSMKENTVASHSQEQLKGLDRKCTTSEKKVSTAKIIPKKVEITSQVERETEDFFSSRYLNLIKEVEATGMDRFPGGKQVPVEFIGENIAGFSSLP